MRDDHIRQRLVDQNPWWRAAATRGDPSAWRADDPTLRARGALDLGYRPTTLTDVSNGPVDDKLVVVRGPRRVGKSVLVKDAISALCTRPDVDSRQIIYLACDGLRAEDLTRVEKLGRDLTRSVTDTRRIWLLDEVAGIPQWTTTVKYLRDNTELSRDTVICTGSSWELGAEIERDLFAGRAGSGSHERDRLLLPMTFREVLAAWGESLPDIPVVRPWDLQGQILHQAVDALQYYVDDLDLRWQAYLSCGGYPRAVAEYHRDGIVSDAFIADLAAWLHRDVDPDAAEESIPLLLNELHRRSVAPLALTDLAQALGYSKRAAAELRLTRLLRAYAGLECCQVDTHGRRVPRTQSKFYLIDPLLAWIPQRLRSGLPPPDLTYLSEGAIGVALGRVVNSLQPGRWQSRDTIGYVRTGGGNEIDFGPIPVPSNHSPMLTTPIESKWVASMRREDARVIENTFQRGVLATRNTLDLKHPVWSLPAPIVALILQ